MNRKHYGIVGTSVVVVLVLITVATTLIPIYSVSVPNCVNNNNPSRLSVIRGDTKQDIDRLEKQAWAEHALFLCVTTKSYKLYIL